MAKARDVMHTGAECINEDENMLTAARMMRDLNVGSLPICGNDDKLHGILTDRDIVVRCVAEGYNPADVRAGDLAQGRIQFVEADAPVDDVLQTMERNKIRRVPVIENHRLVGMISEADLARHLSEHQLAEFVESIYAAR
jgi:CBS domain-containing protein